jgi:hypothetical protein
VRAGFWKKADRSWGAAGIFFCLGVNLSTPPTIPLTQPLAILQAKWVRAIIEHRALGSDETGNALRQIERDYVFLWRRTRHRIIWGARAFQDRAKVKADR